MNRLASASVMLAFCIAGVVSPAFAETCLYREDDRTKIDRSIAAKDVVSALNAAEALYRIYDTCEKAHSNDEEIRVINRSWRADIALVIKGIHQRAGRRSEAQPWIEGACRDWHTVMNATSVDTTTRKIAVGQFKKNCRR